MEPQEKNPYKDKVLPWKAFFFFSLACFFCSVATAATGEREKIIGRVFPPSSSYIISTATAAAEQGRPDTYVETTESFLTKDQEEKVKKGLFLIGVSVNNMNIGASGFLLDIEDNRYYLATNKHVLRLDDPYMHQFGPDFDNFTRTPTINRIDIDEQTRSYYEGFHYEPVPNSDIVVLEIEDSNNPFTTDDITPYSESHRFKPGERIASLSFPRITVPGNGQTRAYYAEGFYVKNFSTNTPVFSINLESGSSGGPAISLINGSPTITAISSLIYSPHILNLFDNQAMMISLQGVGPALKHLKSTTPQLGKHQ